MSVFIGRLPTRNFDDRDLEDIFYKYGKIVSCQVKQGVRFAFGFIEFENPEDAYDAIRDVDGLEIDGTRIVVEKAKGTPHKQNDTTCYNCGEEGHWARDCRRNDHRRRDRYRGSYGRSRSPYGRSPYGGRSPYRRSRSPYGRERDYYRRNSRGRSYSRSRSPLPPPPPPHHFDDRRGRSYSRSPSPRRYYSRSPPPPPPHDQLNEPYYKHDESYAPPPPPSGTDDPQNNGRSMDPIPNVE